MKSAVMLPQYLELCNNRGKGLFVESQGFFFLFWVKFVRPPSMKPKTTFNSKTQENKANKNTRREHILCSRISETAQDFSKFHLCHIPPQNPSGG